MIGRLLGHTQIGTTQRYAHLIDTIQWPARRLAIHGVHFHVGVPGGAESVAVVQSLAFHLPLFLAASASSPFWLGTDTGMASSRTKVFEGLPTAGLPPRLADWHEFESLMDGLLTAGVITSIREIWWDIRPHPVYPTLEFRISDICTNVDDCICIAAMFQAICAKLLKLRRNNLSWRQYRHVHISENKWRAVRYGIDGELIDFGIQESVPFPHLLGELLEFVDDVVDELDCRQEVAHVHTILRDGTSADKQLRVYREHGGDANQEEALRAVVGRHGQNPRLQEFRLSRARGATDKRVGTIGPQIELLKVPGGVPHGRPQGRRLCIGFGRPQTTQERVGLGPPLQDSLRLFSHGPITRHGQEGDGAREVPGGLVASAKVDDR